MITGRSRLLLAQATLALAEELGRQPTDAELQLLRRVLVKAVARMGSMRSSWRERNRAKQKEASHASRLCPRLYL
jgi:hypothetical protein